MIKDLLIQPDQACSSSITEQLDKKIKYPEFGNKPLALAANLTTEADRTQPGCEPLGHPVLVDLIARLWLWLIAGFQGFWYI